MSSILEAQIAEIRKQKETQLQLRDAAHAKVNELHEQAKRLKGAEFLAVVRERSQQRMMMGLH